MKSDDIILICGKIRSGKSYWLKDHLKNLEKSKIRYIIWDYNWEHEPPKRSGYIINKQEEIIPYFNHPVPYIIFRPLVKDEANFDLFCEACNELNNIVVVVEEVERFATPHVMPPHLKMIIDTGSHHSGLGLICTTRRIMRTNGDIPFNSSYIIIFKQNRPQDLKYLSEYVGEEVYALPKLPDYYFLVYDSNSDSLTTHRSL